MTEVVVGVDGSAGSAAALDWALAEAGRRGAPLRALQAWQPPPRLLEVARGAAAARRAEEEVRAVLAEAVTAAVRRTGLTGVPVTRAVVEGHPVQTLVQASGPGVLLVTGGRGRGALSGLLLGSVSQSVAQYAHGPLVVVPHAADGRPGQRPAESGPSRVVVGVDGSPACAAAVRFAQEAARLSGALLHVVHAWVDTVSGYGGAPWTVPRRTLEEEAREALEVSLAVLGDDPGVEVRAETVEGLEYGVLLDTSQGADLLVVGARGGGGWKGLLLGSVGVHCVAAAPCPVAVVRPAPAR